MKIPLRHTLKAPFKVNLRPHKPGTWTGTYQELILTAGTEGEERTVDEGGTYTWSSEVSFWIRQEAYNLIDNIEQLAQVDGDLVPSSEDPALSELTGGTGAISVVDSRVLFNTSIDNASSAYGTINFAASEGDESILMQGEFEITDHDLCSLDHYAAHQIGTVNGAKKVYLSLYRHVDGGPRLVDYLNNTLDSVVGPSPDVTAGPVFFEVLINKGNWVRVWANNAESHFLHADWSAFADHTNRQWLIGDQFAGAGYGSQKIYVRQVKYIRLTRDYASLIQTTGTEGQEVTVTEGGTYTYSAIIGHWIRKEAYDISDNDIDIDSQIDGDVVPSSETPAWTDSTGNGGAITSDGTKVKWDTIDNKAEWADSWDSIHGGSRLIEGSFELTHSGSCGVHQGTSHVIETQDAVKRIKLDLYHHTYNALRFTTDAGVTVVGTYYEDVDLTTGEMFLEIVVDQSGDVQLFVDHGADPVGVASYSSFSSIGSSLVRIGDLNSSNGSIELTGRNIKVIELD